MEQIVEQSGVAKTTIYRHFPTKDDLIKAYLEEEDAEFWRQWEAVISDKAEGVEQLTALCDWIGDRVMRKGYRGCPQINVAAEFSDKAHPAFSVAQRHKKEMTRRLCAICKNASLAGDPSVLALQISLIFDGAFSSYGRLSRTNAAEILRSAVLKLV